MLQGSDFHLHPGPVGAHGLPEELRTELAQGALEGFREFCALAGREEVDAVLIPGDLFDGEQVEDSLLAEVLKAVAGCGAPVLVAPGNHDYYAPGGYWTRRYWRDRKLPVPENLVLFDSGEFENRSLPGAEDRATVTGVCFRSGSEPGCGLRVRAPQDERIHVLMFHGSFTGSSFPEKSQPLPFSRQELLELGFDYTALGHYHSHVQIHDERGILRGAYGGIPQPRWFGEAAGSTGALLVDIRSEEGKASRVEAKLVGLERHRFLSRRIDITGASAVSDVEAEIRAALDQLAPRPLDPVRLELHGFVAPHLDPSSLVEGMSPEGMHLEIHAGEVLPDHDLNRDPDPDDVTVEAAFRRRMKARIETARREGNEAEAYRCLRAFAYGMDALRYGRVWARHVD